MARTSRFLAPVMVLALLLSAVAVVLPSQQVFAADEVWDIALNFTTNPSNGSQAMTIGTVIGGSADPLVTGAPDNDSPAPPRAPASVAAAWLRTPGSNTAIIDRRDVLSPNAGNSVSWSVILSASDVTGTETTMTLAWPAISGVANFPLDATIVLTGLGPAVNMRAQTSVQVAKGNYTATITVTRLGPPSTVWVDDSWAGTTNGDIVGSGYIFGYNAFDTIQGGIDAVASPGTVNVLPGNYSAFNITDDDVQVIGQTGAVVYGNAFVYADRVTIENLVFHGTVSCHGTHDVYLRNLECIGSAVDGIRITADVPNATVYVQNPVIHGCVNGIYVDNDTAIITNPDIYDCQYGVYVTNNGVVDITGGSITSSSNHGIFVGGFSTAAVSGTEIYQGFPVSPETADPQGVPPSGIFVSDYSTVTVDACCDIHDNFYGIYVQLWGELTANGNNIYDNEYGVWYEGGMPFGGEPGVVNGFDDLNCEENWWGHPEGPSTPYWYSDTEPASPWYWNDDKGDRVTFGIDYTPWLDGPCPGGDPVGMNANFKGVARSGEPGLKVQFTDLSTPAPGCEIEEWLWNFGDGSTSTEQNPFHVYNREGAFNVSLTVWDSCGFEQTITMKAYVTIKKPSKQDTVEPAKLGVSYLNIDPAQVLPNQEVTVSANICNNGEERGTRTVSLMVSGEAVASQSVGVSGGSCQQVVFKTSRAVPGTYQVAIDGMTGEFSVLAPRTVTRNVPSQQQTGLGTAGIIAIIAVIIVLIAALIMVFRRD